MSSKPPLIFVGSRFLQKTLHLTAELNGYKILGILDHHYYGRQDSIGGAPVIGDERWLLDPENTQAQQWLKDCVFFPANWWIGQQALSSNELDLQKLRQDRIAILEASGANVISLIHPSSQTIGANSKYADLSIGKGVFIGEHCTISTDYVTIGDYCSIVMVSNILACTTLEKNVCVAPDTFIHHCNIGNDSYVGVGCRFDQPFLAQNGEYHVGENCTLWANSRVNKDIPANCILTHHGRILKKQKFINKEST